MEATLTASELGWLLGFLWASARHGERLGLKFPEAGKSVGRKLLAQADALGYTAHPFHSEDLEWFRKLVES